MVDYKNTIFDVTKVVPLGELVSTGFDEQIKNDWLVGHNKVRKTNNLFLEFEKESRSTNFNSVFTLVDCRPLHYKDYNGMARYDLKQLYMACLDITEVEFVSKFLYDNTQWQKILNNKTIRPYVDKWRDEHRLQVKSSVYSVLLNDALDQESKTKTSSAKYLLEKYYDPNIGKKQTKKTKDKDNEELKTIQSDKDRMLKGLRLN